MLLDAAPWLLGGFVLAGVAHVLLPVELVTRRLGKRGFGSILRACLIGIPLPLCSCSVIPVATSIRKQGASRGAFVSFLISTPETGVDSIALSYALLGPLMTVVRPLAAFTTAVLAGFLLDRDRAIPEEVESSTENAGNGCAAACDCPTEPPLTMGKRMKAALRYGLVDLFADLSPYLVAGFVLAGVAAALMPPGFLETYVGSGLPAMLLMLVVGLPLYICATSSTPLAAALIAGGLSPGAALVLLLVGPATNIATMLVVARDVSRRGLLVYLGSIAVCAIFFGLVVDWAATRLPVSAVDLPSGCGDCTSPNAWPFAVIVILLALNGLRMRARAGAKAI